MTDQSPVYPVPQTQEEEEALIKALSTRTVEKLEQAKALFEGERFEGFRADLDALIALRLPATIATAQNATNLSSFLGNMQRVVQQDLDAANAVLAPPPAPVPAVPALPPVT